MRADNSLDTEVLVLWGRKLKGFTSSEAPVVQDMAERVTFSQLTSPDFAAERQAPDDMYLVSGVHKEKTFRILKDDCMFYSKDDYGFNVVALDFDYHQKDGRNTWGSASQAGNVIHHLIGESELIRDSAFLVTSSRGGIRVIFLISKSLNAPEFQNFYDAMEVKLLQEFSGHRISNKVASIKVGEHELHLDRRNPYSLTRVPYGYRDNKQVVNSEYFYESRLNNTIQFDHFGEPTEAEALPFVIPGYRKASISFSHRKPKPTEEAKLPSGIHQFRWPNDEPPLEGGREFAIFKIVNTAKMHFKDRMTPEQYFTYFKQAILKMDSKNASIPPLDQLWMKITKDWLVRLDSDTTEGTDYDKQQMTNSGNNPLYKAVEYDNAMDVESVYDYAQDASAEYTQQLVEKTSGCTFFNPPPGGGKSTVAIEVLRQRGGIYIAPSNKQILDFIKKFKGRTKVNHVLSYRSLISVICEGDDTLIAVLTELYDNVYAPLRPPAELQAKKHNSGDIMAHKVQLIEVRGKQWGVASFPSFLRTHAEGLYKYEGKRIHKENVRRMVALEEGELSVLTHAKFMFMISREGVRDLNPEHLIIFDECQPLDVVNPEVFMRAPMATVYGSLQRKPWLEDIARQCEFNDIMRKHNTIFINADRGLDRALKHNGFEDVEVIGRDMSPVLDNDLHVVLSPSMKAGFTPHRNVNDTKEYSPRALYAQSVNERLYTLITNGSDVNGKALAGRNNLVNMVGSNDYLNSKVVSMLTSPTPHQVAELMYSMGCDEKVARKLLFQNQINQVISRNVGYRSFAVVSKYMECAGETLPSKDNTHILVLPYTAINDEFDIIVKTPNVWSISSPNPPACVIPYLRSVTESTKVTGALYSIEPGEILSVADFAALIREERGVAKDIFLKTIESDMLADFSYISDRTIRGERHKNSIHRCHTLKVVLKEVIDSLDGESVTMKTVSDLLQEATSERYMKSMTAKYRKEFIAVNAFRYDYRVVRDQRGLMLVRTDEKNLFK